MRRFLLGALCNAGAVVIGFLVIGFMATAVIESGLVSVEQIPPDGQILWLSVVNHLLNTAVAAGASYAHVRLIPPDFLGTIPAVLVAALLTCAVNALVAAPFLIEQAGLTEGLLMLGLAAAGAVLGGVLAARRRRS